MFACEKFSFSFSEFFMRNLRRIAVKKKRRYKFKQRDTFLHISVILVILLPRLIHFMIFPETDWDFDLIKLKIEIGRKGRKMSTRNKIKKAIGWKPKVIKNSFYKILINKQISEFESHYEKFINKRIYLFCIFCVKRAILRKVISNFSVLVSLTFSHILLIWDKEENWEKKT